MIKDKVFEHRPIGELMAIVKNDFSKFDAEGLIDDGRLIKTVMWCNEKLGMPIREIREVAIPVGDFRAELPVDFEKLFYVCALEVSNTMVTGNVNPWDNQFDSDVIYEANLDRESLGCVDNYQVIVKRLTNTTIHQHGTWTELEVGKSSEKHCHIDCPNKRKRGKYQVEINEDHIDTPFRSGTLYLMYVGMMKDVEGNITFPFHPMITPYYEWSVKEKLLEDAIFNSDATNISELYQLASKKRSLAWLDAFNFTTERSYGDFVEAERRKELSWYAKYFRYLQ